MGFLSKLKKFALPAAGVGAMFLPGGQAIGAGLLAKLVTASKGASALAPVLGAASKSRGEAQQTQERNQLSRDQLALQGKQFSLGAVDKRRGQALKSSMIANYKPRAPMTHARANVVNFNSPFGNAEAFTDPRMKQLANEQLDQSLQAVLKGEDKFTPAAAPKSGIIDKALGVGSFGAGLLGALNTAGAFNRKPRVAPMAPSTNPDEELYG